MNASNVEGPSLIGYGLIGAGRFGRFCLQNYRGLSGLKPVAVADVDRSVAREAGEETGAAVESIDALLARADVDLLHIATPPFTHYELVMRALEAGKHVLCEKPLAIELEHAQQMLAAARKHHRVLAVNLIMRYNPLCQAVKQIVDEQLLGQPLHGFFENYAKDEPIGPDHWFWQRDKSGGIFVEHGVHFFDLFEWWLGEGAIESAQQVVRPGTARIEQVNCTARYGDALVNFYHGFTQPTQMDRQELRLHFERGTVQLFEWIPTRITIDALVTKATRDRLAELLPAPRQRRLESIKGSARSVTGRDKTIEADGRYRLRSRAGRSKDALYGHVLRQLLADQLAAIHDSRHRRVIDEAAGQRSLAMALAADAAARGASAT